LISDRPTRRPSTKAQLEIVEMRFWGSAAVIGVSLSVVGVSTAAADQCPEKNSPIATDRPDVTN
jgi:hypothetical protein